MPHANVAANSNLGVGMKTYEKALIVVLLPLAAVGCSAVPSNSDTIACRRFTRMQECVAVPMASVEEDKSAKAFLSPADGTSRVYLVRPYTTSPKDKAQVFVDGKPVAQLGPLTYAVIDVSPGKHRLSANTDVNSDFELNVRKGDIHYVQYQLNLLFNTVTGEMKLLDENAGQQKVMATKRVALSP